MPRTAEAVSHGAITIVNAMATGKGAALGINLLTRARVTITDQAGVFTGQNLSDPDEDTMLMKTTARRVLQRFKVHKRYGATVETESNIPVAVGLKSSSAASNAIALATSHALGKDASDLETVNLGVDASLEAGVTLTGAYDDACASYFGGLVVTDNVNRRILRRFKPKGHLRILIHLPDQKRYTKDIDPRQLGGIKPFVQLAHREAMRENYWCALTLNGLIYCMALGQDTSAAKQALASGAIAAGLSGKGPAVAAIVPTSRIEEVLSAWDSLSGRIIEASLNFEKATLVRTES